MSETPWLQYHLEALEFHNGARLGFRRARLRYNEDDNEILIDQLDASRQDIDAALREIASADGRLPEIKTIFYEMKFAGYPPIAFFYHPIQQGAEIFLRQPRGAASVLFFRQRDGRPLFSKAWTAREVTRGRVDDDRAVWQFHGYKHEH